MTKIGLTLAALAVAMVPWATGAWAQQDCGSAETPCVVPSGTYHLRLPEIAARGAVVYLHGAGARGDRMLGSNLARLATEAGFIFAAPNGFHRGQRFERNWSVRAEGSAFEVDDVVFVNEVIASLEEAYGINRDAVLIAGFSRGGSMTWDIACIAPKTARAYAPVAGAFWDPMPQGCGAPVDLFHTHGWDDRTVPLEGRPLGGGRIVQGDVWQSLFILRRVNGCAARQPSRSAIEDDRWWRHWEDCTAGRIDLMLHPGGHGVPRGWAAQAMAWFEARLSEGAQP